MPNWVTTYIKGPTATLTKLIHPTSGHIDFEQVIPCTLPYPDAVSVFSLDSLVYALVSQDPFKKLTIPFAPVMLNETAFPTPGTSGAFDSAYRTLKNLSEEVFRDLLKEIANYRATNHANWYTWNISNWGTKWNAGESLINYDGEETIVWFETAWNHPEEVVTALSRLAPASKFSVAYADEDLGNNCGIYEMIDGGVIPNTYQVNEQYNTPQWIKFALNLRVMGKPVFHFNRADFDPERMADIEECLSIKLDTNI